jgi:large repetitive protein
MSQKRILSAWKFSDCAGLYPVNSATVPCLIQTDPLNPDTDGDLLPDGYELGHDLNGSDPADGNADDDADNLTRGEEYILGTDHTLPDTDGDLYSDGEEIVMGSDPLDPTDPGTVREEEEENTTTTTRQNTQDALNLDSDGDGVSDYIERKNGTNPNDPNSVLPPNDINEQCEKLHNR